MRRRRLACLTVGAALLAGCVPAPATRPPAPPPPPAAVPSALAGFAAARAHELAAAHEALDAIVQATAQQPPVRRVRPRGIVSLPIEVTERASGQSRSVDSFDSLTVDLPLDLRGTPVHDAAMTGVKILVHTLAELRGSAEVVRGFAPADVRNEHLPLGSASAKAPGGQDIVVRRQSDPEVLRGFERITIRGPALPGQL